MHCLDSPRTEGQGSEDAFWLFTTHYLREYLHTYVHKTKYIGRQALMASPAGPVAAALGRAERMALPGTWHCLVRPHCCESTHPADGWWTPLYAIGKHCCYLCDIEPYCFSFNRALHEHSHGRPINMVMHKGSNFTPHDILDLDLLDRAVAPARLPPPTMPNECPAHISMEIKAGK